MNNHNPAFTVEFPEDYDDLAAFEHEAKGYLGGVTVCFSGGPAFELYFIDPVRLQQDFEAELENGRRFLAEPNMVVIAEVTREGISAAIPQLVNQGFFEAIGPRSPRPRP